MSIYCNIQETQKICSCINSGWEKHIFYWVRIPVRLEMLHSYIDGPKHSFWTPSGPTIEHQLNTELPLLTLFDINLKLIFPRLLCLTRCSSVLRFLTCGIFSRHLVLLKLVTSNRSVEYKALVFYLGCLGFKSRNSHYTFSLRFSNFCSKCLKAIHDSFPPPPVHFSIHCLSLAHYSKLIN